MTLTVQRHIGTKQLEAVRYAHPDGNNANDGLSWTTAKKDILGAYDALPSFGGKITFFSGTYVDAVNTDRGLWIVGPNSPDNAAPPVGWRRQKGQFFELEGVPADSYRKTGTAWLFGGSGSDRAKPTIWIQGVNKAHWFTNVRCRYPAVGVRIGITADQTSRNINTSGIVFRNLEVQLNQIPGNGPGVDMGYCFWTYFIDSHLSGNGVAITITAATAASNVATFTTNTAHAFLPGEYVYVHEVTPSGYNGGWKVLTVPTSTTFTAQIESTPAVGSAFGHVHPIRSDRYCALLADGRGGASPGPIGYNTTMDGTGIRYWVGDTSWGLIWQETIAEGDFVHPIGPAIEILNGNGFGVVNLSDISRADVGTTPQGVEGATVEVSPGTPASVVNILNVTDINGPATVLGGLYRPGVSNRSLSLGGTLGWEGNRIVGRHDAANRRFGFASVIRPNLATDDVNLWSGLAGAATVTTGIQAPDGSTRAAKLVSSSGIQDKTLWSLGSYTAVLGDIFVFGGWWRKLVAGYTDINTYAFGSNNTSVIFNDTGNTAFIFPTNHGTQWQFMMGLCEVTGGAGLVNDLGLSIRAFAGSDCEYYAPMMLMFPVSLGIPESEIRDYVLSLGTWPKDAPAGHLAAPRGAKVLTSAGIGVGNSTLATVPGTVQRRLEVFDAVGNSIGFVPVYGHIGSFSPASVAGLIGHYDFSDLSSLHSDVTRTTPISADGQMIKGMTDLSGAGNHVTEASSGPTYKQLIVGSKSIGRFTANTQRLASPAVTLPQPFTVFMVNDRTTVGQAMELWGGGGAVMNAHLDGDKRLQLYAGSQIVSGTAPVTTRSIHVGQFNTTASKLWVNGGTGVGGNVGTGALVAQPWYLGFIGNGGLIGDMSEVLIFDSVLSLTDINLIGAYLADKWGLTWTTAT